jgi:L-fucono-1,5-lactonase
MMQVDAHLHVWDRARADYPWLGPELGAIHRDMPFEEVRPQLRRAGIGGAVLVQAADNDDDTRNMLAVADRYPDVLGVVGWLPLDQPEEVAARLPGWRDDPRLVGVRCLIHDMTDLHWILRPDVGRSLDLLADADLSFDYVTSGPAALAHVPRIAREHPGLRIVIDHLGKPPVGGDAAAVDEWRALLAEAARHPEVSAKLSGLYAAGPDRPLDGWTADEVAAVVRDAFELFGAARLMAGGDWPICLLAGGYQGSWQALTGALDGRDAGERQAVLGGTAAEVYRLAPARLAAAAGTVTDAVRIRQEEVP